MITDKYTSYSFIKNLLIKNQTEYEDRLLKLFATYGQDYENFINNSVDLIKIFCKRHKKPTGFYLNNTIADASIFYVTVRDMLEKADKDPLIFEFSPRIGWSTFLLLRAIKDSGRTDSKVISYELNTSYYIKALSRLSKVSDHIHLPSLEMVNGDALTGIKNLENKSVDLMIIDSDHAGEFAAKYIEAGVFTACKDNAYVSVHDFHFHFIDKEKDEAQQVTEYFINNPGFINNKTLGHAFMLLGGNITNESRDAARHTSIRHNEFMTDVNFFVRNDLPEKFWLGGSIDGINGRHLDGNKWHIAAYALWLLPK